MLVKISTIIVGTCITAAALGYFYWYKSSFTSNSNSFEPIKIVSKENNSTTLKKLQQQATSLKTTVKKNGFNERYVFLIDMSIHSGRKRFFVYNLQKDSIEKIGLVTHGSGSITGNHQLHFSNIPNSNCTSLGRYKIGKNYKGRFGLAYKLHGLDKTNDKAFARFVVLHGHSCVPYNEVYPIPICPSSGCPTVAPDFLLELKKYIEKSQQPLLLSIYQ
ncbi:MAG: murein L,D-transpeptidase catalytic domain-containing protein [Ferruginibacter sp.]